jgi:hypothetical protein
MQAITLACWSKLMLLTKNPLAVGMQNFLKFPLHFLQIFTGAKSFEKNALLGSRFLNANNLHVFRVSLAMRMAAMRRRRLAALVTAEQAVAYERDGFVRLDNFLDEDHFQALLHEVKDTDFDRVDMQQGSTITRRSMIDDADLDSRPAIQQARNDNRLLNLVRYIASHAGQPLVTLQTVLAKANGNPDPQSELHSDTFHATAKAWLFLTDVEEDDGLFCYVAGSHKITAQRYAWEKSISTELDSVENRYSRRGSLRLPQDQLSMLGYPQPTKMVVKANTLVVADTHGFHARCASPKNTTRIEIYASLRRGPYLPFAAAPLGGLHIAALPFIKRRINHLVISGLGQMNRLGIRGNPWKSIGRGKTDEWTHGE